MKIRKRDSRDHNRRLAQALADPLADRNFRGRKAKVMPGKTHQHVPKAQLDAVAVLVAKGESVKDAARAVDVEYDKVLKCLHERGVRFPRKPATTTPYREQIVNLYQRGLTARAIASDLGLGKSAVYSVIHNAGLPLTRGPLGSAEEYKPKTAEGLIGVQIRILQTLADGGSLKQLAMDRGVTRAAPSRLLVKAREALRAESTPHAVAIALRRGYIR